MTLGLHAQRSYGPDICDFCLNVSDDSSGDGSRTFEAYTFSEDLIEPVCSAGLINFRGTLFFSNPATNSSRTHMTLKSSTSAAYSSLCGRLSVTFSPKTGQVHSV